MKGKTALLIITLLSTSLVFGTFFTFPVAQSSTHVYPDDFPSQTLQEAIWNDTVKDGDTIFVQKDTYHVHLNVNKSITLKGFDKDETILDGDGTGTVIKVNLTNYVKIFEFTIQNGQTGVYLNSTSNCNVSRNIIKDNFYGVQLSGSSYCTMKNNDIKRNVYNFGVFGDSLGHFMHDIDVSNKVDSKPIYYWVNKTGESIPVDAGYVAIVNSTGITAEKLSLRSNIQGVLVAYSSEIVVKNLEFRFPSINLVDGIVFSNVTNSVVQNVTSINLVDGIVLIDSENNRVQNNMVLLTSSYSCGIKLTRSTKNFIFSNTIRNDYDEEGIGIYLSSCLNNSIIANNVSKTYFGIALGNSNGSLFFHNNILYNLNQVVKTNSFDNRFDNGYEGNHWSDYTGEDNGNGGRIPCDGIGDTLIPHHGDSHPLMEPWSAYRIFRRPMKVEVYANYTQKLYTFSNSTLGPQECGFYFDWDLKEITFKVTSGYTGFLNITIPRKWIDWPFNVTVDGDEVSFQYNGNESNWSLYITYDSGKHILKIKGTERGSIIGDLNDDGVVDVYDAVKLSNNAGAEEKNR